MGFKARKRRTTYDKLDPDGVAKLMDFVRSAASTAEDLIGELEYVHERLGSVETSDTCADCGGPFLWHGLKLTDRRHICEDCGMDLLVDTFCEYIKARSNDGFPNEMLERYEKLMVSWRTRPSRSFAKLRLFAGFYEDVLCDPCEECTHWDTSRCSCLGQCQCHYKMYEEKTKES